LAIARSFKTLGFDVIALCRHSSADLTALNVRVIEGVDVGTSAGREQMVNQLANVTIDILINNAGILRDESLGTLDEETIMAQFAINALAPLQVVDLLADQLQSGSKVALITSRMGSISDNGSGGRYGYRMSKAALNAAGMSLSKDLAPREVSVGLYHPGYVQTDMVGNNGDISATTAAARLVALINNQDMSQTGLFKHSNGDILPW